jgi:hypothetical protein
MHNKALLNNFFLTNLTKPFHMGLILSPMRPLNDYSPFIICGFFKVNFETHFKASKLAAYMLINLHQIRLALAKAEIIVEVNPDVMFQFHGAKFLLEKLRNDGAENNEWAITQAAQSVLTQILCVGAGWRFINARICGGAPSFPQIGRLRENRPLE